MNKNTIIGFIAIGAIMFGFTWYQSKETIKQQQEKARQEALAKQQKAVVDSVLAATLPVQDSLITVNVTTEPGVEPVASVAQIETPVVEEVETTPFKDSVLNAAYQRYENVAVHTISNSLVEIEFTSKGAQPYSVRIKDFNAYNPKDPKNPNELYFMRKGWSDYSISFNLDKSISARDTVLHTEDFVFAIEDTTSSQIIMKLPFEGGYIQQKYWLEEGEYMLKNELTVVGLDKLVSDSAKEYKTNWNFLIPRLEKVYSNEKRYSKLDYYSGGDEPEVMAEGENDSESVNSSFEWFAFQQQFFSAIMTPERSFKNAKFNVKFMSEKKYNENGALMLCDAKLGSKLDPSADTLVAKCNFYFGPNDYKTLKSYDRHYERIIPLGGWMVSWFNRWVVIPVFDFLGRFIDNYGIIILLLTLLVKLLLSPLTIKSYKSTAKMQALRPEIQQINEKYPKKEDAMKKQQAMMNLYQKAGVSPMGGCLPMLLQMPILFAMFRFFPASVELRQQSFLWADDLSSYDSAIHFSDLPLIGDHISLFALLMAASMYVYSKMNSAQMGDNGMPGMKFMSLYLMPIMMFFICNSLPAALSYYYFLSNLITMGMTWYIRKYVVTEEKVRAEMARAALKPRKKSKWQLRLEEAQRMQEQMQREKKNRRR